MNYPEACETVRRSRKSQMTPHIYKNGAPLTALIKRLEFKIDAEFVTQNYRQIIKVIFATKLIFLVVQPVWAQQSVHIGSKNTMPEVIVNLDAIFGGSNTGFKKNLPSMQPNREPNFGSTQLLIPNLQTSNNSRTLKLRSPGMGGLAFSQPTPVPARKTETGEGSTNDARIVPTVSSPSSSLLSKGREVLVAVLPSVPLNSENNQPAQVKPTPVLKKRMGEKKVTIARKEPKFIRSAKVSKSPSVLSKKRLNPPLPPPPRKVIDKRKLSKMEAPAATKIKAKKLEKFSAGPAKNSKTKLDQVVSLRPAGDRILEIRFRSGSSVLTRNDEKMLINFAQKIRPAEIRMQLKAFAEATGNNSSKARRLSLSRALAVRSFLIENGLRSTSIDVRALGIARDGGAPDRVDIVALER